MVEKRMWNVGITIVMPAHAVIVEAATEEEAVKLALCMLNEAGSIPEHGTCDVHAEIVPLCTSDDPNDHQGDTCPVHEGAEEI